MKILLIEDNPADALLFSRMIRNTEGPQHIITVTQTIRESQAVLSQDVFDAAFIDLNLPDSAGLESLHAVLQCQPEIPVIILTGINDEELGSQAIHEGAQDFLPKDVISYSVLTRSLRHSIERKKMSLELQHNAQKAQQEVQDLRELMQAQPIISNIAAINTCLSSVSGQIGELVSGYSKILEQAVTEQIYETDNQHARLLKKLVERLGSLNAMPKDIIQIHLLAIDEIIARRNVVPEHVYIEEGRMLLLEIMGELASNYRELYISGI